MPTSTETPAACSTCGGRSQLEPFYVGPDAGGRAVYTGDTVRVLEGDGAATEGSWLCVESGIVRADNPMMTLVHYITIGTMNLEIVARGARA